MKEMPIPNNNSNQNNGNTNGNNNCDCDSIGPEEGLPLSSLNMEIDSNLKNDFESIFNNSKVSLFNVILILFIIFLCIYLAYYYITNK
jgi:hypothetical protein